jgi:hypothetical protein
MSEKPLKDLVSVTDYFFGLTLAYAGYPLVKVTRNNRSTELQFLCPRFDFDECWRQYCAGELSVSDIKSFGVASSRIATLIKDVKRDGEPWFNPEFVHHFLD